MPEVAITLGYRHQPEARAPQVCLKKSAHCSWRAKLGEEASCLRRPVCGCYWLIVCLHSWLLSALILFCAEYRPYGGRSFKDRRSPFGYTPSESRSPAAYRTPHPYQGDLMAIQYKVVELKGQSDPRSSGETPEVTAEAIETALNQQGRDNWELFTILERFTETSHTEESHYAGIGSSSQRYSARIAVTLIFKKIMA